VCDQGKVASAARGGEQRERVRPQQGGVSCKGRRGESACAQSKIMLAAARSG